MIIGVLGVAFFLMATGVVHGQTDCPKPAPVRLVSNITPAIGQSPLWVAAGDKPLRWKAANVPVKLLWIRDAAAKGQGWLTGKAREGTGKTTFSRALYGLPLDRLPLDEMGEKIDGIKPADMQKFAFYWTYVYFSGPGCYEITARIGRQQAVFHLLVVPETS